MSPLFYARCASRAGVHTVSRANVPSFRWSVVAGAWRAMAAASRPRKAPSRQRQGLHHRRPQERAHPRSFPRAGQAPGWQPDEDRHRRRRPRLGAPRRPHPRRHRRHPRDRPSPTADANPIGFQAGDVPHAPRPALRLPAPERQHRRRHPRRLRRARTARRPRRAARGPLRRADERPRPAQCKADRTRFLNPTGLDTKERPFSTAATTWPASRARPSTRRTSTSSSPLKERRITIDRAGAKSDYLLKNTNELLGTHNVDGGKTGQTARAGGCLMVTSNRPAIVWQEGDRHLQDHPAARHHRARFAGPFPGGDFTLIDEGHQPCYDQWMAAGHQDGRTAALSEKTRTGKNPISHSLKGAPGEFHEFVGRIL